MQTTLIGLKQNSGMQQMGETREPMARDCWQQAQDLAVKYGRELKRDFWVLYAAKPHVKHQHAIVAGWYVSVSRPPEAMVGVLVFKWDNELRELMPEPDLCLPYDVPISSAEMSTDKKEVFGSIEQAAKKSGSILLA